MNWKCTWNSSSIRSQLGDGAKAPFSRVEEINTIDSWRRDSTIVSRILSQLAWEQSPIWWWVKASLFPHHQGKGGDQNLDAVSLCAMLYRRSCWLLETYQKLIGACTLKHRLWMTWLLGWSVNSWTLMWIRTRLRYIMYIGRPQIFESSPYWIFSSVEKPNVLI